jgi:hypothetical protein
MNNLEIYNKVRAVPADAKKPIAAGRLKGKTDINPMWRIKILTEQFGVCGTGWKYVVDKLWTENGGKSEIAAFALISLYVKNGENWSDAIPGIGGSSFVAEESRGLYTSDECYKMALTDAISVACKALGVGADVYWESDKSKYDRVPAAIPVKSPIIPTTPPEPPKVYECFSCKKPFRDFKHNGKSYTAGQAFHMSETKYGGKAYCFECGKTVPLPLKEIVN